MEHAYGTGSPFTVGMEEELFLVDPESLLLVDTAAEVLARLEAPAGDAGHEAYSSEIELRSEPCSTAGGAAGQLAGLRAAARAAGATLLGAGLHPASRWGEAHLVDKPRYARVLETMRSLILRTPECALHVHVGLPDADAAIRAHNELRRHQPLLTALTASSAWWFGADSGLATARAAHVRAYPGRGVPRAFGSWEEYVEVAEAAVAAGGVDDYTYLWWDVRPHPRLGTVEVREMDVQSRSEDSAALGALIQALARYAAESRNGDPLPPPEAIALSAWRASRDGLQATIAHGGSLRPVPEVARDVLARARPHARELGTEDELAGIERILREGNGADRQRAAAARGGLDGLLRALRDETAGAK